MLSNCRENGTSQAPPPFFSPWHPCSAHAARARGTAAAGAAGAAKAVGRGPQRRRPPAAAAVLGRGRRRRPGAAAEGGGAAAAAEAQVLGRGFRRAAVQGRAGEGRRRPWRWPWRWPWRRPWRRPRRRGTCPYAADPDPDAPPPAPRAVRPGLAGPGEAAAPEGPVRAGAKSPGAAPASPGSRGGRGGAPPGGDAGAGAGAAAAPAAPMGRRTKFRELGRGQRRHRR